MFTILLSNAFAEREAIKCVKDGDVRMICEHINETDEQTIKMIDSILNQYVSLGFNCYHVDNSECKKKNR